ncbi:MAG TPA: hypothetical protein VJ436_05240 [Anaerolineales bacterium]|nr:hypothetical protein [Anaerolineales bacterium]
METALIYQSLAGAALVFSVAAFAWRLRAFRGLARPADRAVPKGRPGLGVLYAYTLGMAPWAKESTRRHLLAYLRGVAFHLGIFLGLGILLASPWLGAAPALWKSVPAVGAFMGALFGLAGFAARFFEHNLKALSTRDDYAAVLLVSLFLGSAGLWLVAPASLPVFYLLSAVMLVYAPFSKIRHCIYYASSRLFFGRFFGTRAVLPHGQQLGR